MRQISIFLGVLRYEFRMQIRRRTVWITFLCIGLAFVLIYSRQLVNNPNAFNYISDAIRRQPLLTTIVYWTSIVNTILPLAVGALLADRLPRDRRTHVDELLITTPAHLSMRLLGKYLGSTIATLIPMVAIYLIGIGLILYTTQNLLAIPYALVAFVAIALPGIFFVGAFSIACPAVLWVPLYQFLFIGYWFWGNLLSPNKGIPTLSATILSPDGKYMSSGFFGIKDLVLGQVTTPMQATASILVLLALAAIALFALWGFLKWQQVQQ